MTRLLVSVRSADEARLALLGGADYIDVKEPARGALGAADARVIRAVVQAVDGRVQVSAALGELDGLDHDALDALPGVSFAKFGLAGCASQPNWPARWRAAIGRLPPGTSAVAVAYADWHNACAPRPAEVLEQARLAGCKAVLVDTFDKSGPTLSELWSERELTTFIAWARRERVLSVLAGGLRLVDLADLVRLRPRVVAVRGAACDEGRSGPLRQECVERLAAVVKKSAFERCLIGNE